MLTLQNLLESDSLSSIISKLNNNFQVISLAGGGPQGNRGEQGIPGMPGRIGATGPEGPIGPTGLSTYMIPFATGTSGTTGPSTIAGPWPVASLDYLDSTIGTGGTGDIYIDHFNRGYWMYLSAADGTGQYSNIGPSYPPTGTGFFGGQGWYFYPQPDQIDLTNVWTYDYSTYLTNPPYATGPFDTSSSPLKIPNARFNSKYGTVWISAGNSGTTGSQDYDTPSIESWGQDYGDSILPFPQPGRWNAGVDRLLFKFSIDSLPYHSIINARSVANLDQAANTEDTSYPRVGIVPISGDGYWVKPMYDAPLDDYTPLFFWSELRPDSGFGDERFASLGLYQYTATLATPYGGGAGVTGGSTAGSIFPLDRKSMFLLSTRLAPTPEDYDAMTTGAGISNARTVNLSELVLDVKSLTTSNQVICALPQDLVLSSDYVDSGDDTYREEDSSYPYRVFQGFISAANGKNVGGQLSIANYIDYGAGISATGLFPDMPLLGNQTRRSWYGSGFRFDDVTSWSSNSSDPLSEGYARLAGMAERGKRTWNTSNDDTYFLSELVFYTSQYKLNGTQAGSDHSVSSQDLDTTVNEQRSLPTLYMSPFRNIGIGTFTGDDSGVWEPLARLHAHVNPQALSNADNDPTNIWMQFGNIANKLDVNTELSKVGAFSSSASSSSNQGFIDFYLGRIVEEDYEKANPYGGGLTPVTNTTGNFRIGFRREGWYVNNGLDSFRLGVQPAATGTNIGEILDNYRNEFQFSLHPLNTNATEVDDTKTAITGVGIHNLWPRTRFHAYGKNKYNEADRGATDNDVIYAGYAYNAQGAPSSSYPYYNPNYKSNNQVITDFIGDSYLYPTGILEYPYTALGGSPTAGIGTANLGIYSANAANFPSRENLSPTRHIIPYGNTGSNGALYAAYYDVNMNIVSSTGSFNGAHRHGGTGGAAFKPVNYQGFNLFRDLMNKGDDKDVTNTWIAGSNGGKENGGSAILTNSDGDFAISTIKSGRNGGDPYRIWEQRLSTRDILNNIKLIIKKDGSVGFGNAAGYDADAYSSQERNINTGYLNYVPRQSVANGLSVVPSTAGASAGHTAGWYSGTGAYGMVIYTGVSGTFTESSSSSSAARINANATTAETFRAEFAAEKLHGRPGRTIQNSGWGYPNNGSPIGITGATDVGKYVILKNPANNTYFNNISFSTDIEGRLTSSVIKFNANPTGATSGSLVQDLVEAVILPHPTEFESGAPLASSISFPYQSPEGAVAAAWGGTGAWNSAQLTITLSYEADPIILGNIRLNNFVAGEGLGLSGMNANSADAQAVKAARQKSPRLVFTFLEADSTKIPGGSVAAGATARRPITTTSAYRKVNTVIASAQNESSLREYWIPKTDNTGGTFMVFTDHYGRKEKDSGFDSVTIDVDNFLLEEVVTLEFIYGYTATTGVVGVYGVTGATSNTGQTFYGVVGGGTNAVGNSGGTGYWPAHVLYRNRSMLDSAWPNYGYTGPATTDYDGLFDTDEYAKLYSIGPGVTGTVSWPDMSELNIGPGGTVSTVIRNIDKFYSIHNPATNWDSGWGDPTYTNNASGFRFKRINSEFALVDFNITIAVRNPNLQNNLAPGEGAGAAVGQNQSELIDRGSPRWTQFIRMKYFPSATDPANYQRNLFLYDLFGNGLSFANWSSYKNWYAGWSTVGDDSSSGLLSTSATGDSFYTMNTSTTASANQFFNRWNGNVINYGMSWFYANGTGPGAYIPQDSAFIVDGTGYTWLDARQESNNFLYSQSLNLINTPGTGGDYRQTWFTRYLGAAFQVMGNRAFSRNRSCAWRIVPQFGNYYNDLDGASPAASGIVPRNTFALEVMFDDPIMHHDTPLKRSMFDENTNNSSITLLPYKYLTVSGQSMVRYSNNYTDSWGGVAPPPM
jgi:hypothetical protein